MFTVTKQWLDQHKTPSGAYTGAQLTALGFTDWPPPKGWKQWAIGMQISSEQKYTFELKSNPYKKRPDFDLCMKVIKKLNNTELELLSDACKASISYRENKPNKAL